MYIEPSESFRMAMDKLRAYKFRSALTGSGGVLGTLIGWGLALLVNLTLPVYVPARAPIVGFTVSCGIGFVFGLWPARKAARLDPIQSLRYE